MALALRSCPMVGRRGPMPDIMNGKRNCAVATAIMRERSEDSEAAGGVG